MYNNNNSSSSKNNSNKALNTHSNEKNESKEEIASDNHDKRVRNALQKFKDLDKRREELHKNAKPVRLGLCVFLQSLSNVDSSTQTFQVQFELQVNRELSDSEIISLEENPETFKPNVVTFIVNHAQEVIFFEQRRWYNGKDYFIKLIDDKPFAVVWYIATIVYHEELEYKNFPFDVQHFAITLQPDTRDAMEDFTNLDNIMKYKIDPAMCYFGIPSFATNLLGWDYVDNPHVEMCFSNYSETRRFNSCHVSWIFALKREWQFYVTKVMVVLAIISFTGNFVFVFGDDTISDRFGFLSTMLLTAVAYMFITAEYLPPLKYLTFLDYYVFFTFFFILLLCMQSGFIGHVDDTDLILYFVNLGIWIIVHIIFFVCARKAHKEEMSKYGKSKAEIENNQFWHRLICIETNDNDKNKVKKICKGGVSSYFQEEFEVNARYTRTTTLV